MSGQLLSEMFDWEESLQINKEELLHTLQGELKASGIETPFEFAILRADTIADGVYSKVKVKSSWKVPIRSISFLTAS